MKQYRFLGLAIIASLVIFCSTHLANAYTPTLHLPFAAFQGNPTQMESNPSIQENYHQPDGAPMKLAVGSSIGYPLEEEYPITSPFGYRIHPITGESRLHEGIDIGADYGTPVLAAAPGRVIASGDLGGYGKTVYLEHGRIRTLYAHLSWIAVEEGMWVDQGTLIGEVGSSGLSNGPHLHFETLEFDGSDWVAFNPLELAIGEPGERTAPPFTPPPPGRCDTNFIGLCNVPIPQIELPSCAVAFIGDCS